MPHPPGCPTHHGHAVITTEAPPTYPHHRPVVPARPPPPSVHCRVIRPARRNSKLCTIQYCNITIQYCNTVPYYENSTGCTILPHPPGCPNHHGHAVVATEAPPTYPHHLPVVPARPPPPSVDCRVIRPARRSRCAACCPAALCCHHAARRSRCAFWRRGGIFLLGGEGAFGQKSL